MRACIFGAGDYHGEYLSLCEGALILAADGGLLHTERYGLLPDVVIGDFDSLGRRPSGDTVLVYPVEKDDTDMALAVREALSRGADEILLFGGLGGRLDHTLANITLLLSLCRKKIPAYLIGKECLTVISKGDTLTFSQNEGVCSLFSLSKTATVTLEGLHYPLSRGILKKDTALGVSNRFENTTATVTCHTGDLLAVWEKGDLPTRTHSAESGNIRADHPTERLL